MVRQLILVPRSVLLLSRFLFEKVNTLVSRAKRRQSAGFLGTFHHVTQAEGPVMVPDIAVDENPDPKHREAIFDALIKYNDSKIGAPSLAALAVLLLDTKNGSIAGGLWAHSVYDWLFVELLFVPEEMRRNGIGSRLIRNAEAVAVKRGCIGVWLDTYSFQARGFYEKLGYEIFGILEDYPRGERRYFFRKCLIPPKGDLACWICKG